MSNNSENAVKVLSAILSIVVPLTKEEKPEFEKLIREGLREKGIDDTAPNVDKTIRMLLKKK